MCTKILTSCLMNFSLKISIVQQFKLLMQLANNRESNVTGLAKSWAYLYKLEKSTFLGHYIHIYDMVQLTSKLTLACGEHTCFLQICCVTYSSQNSRVAHNGLHATKLSCTVRQLYFVYAVHTLCAAR